MDPLNAKKLSAGDKFMRCIKAPMRALCKARDLYVRSMIKCASNMSYSVYPSTLPRSFSVATTRPSEEDDLREVMRMVSQRSLREKAKGMTGSAAPATEGANGLPKSHSVAIGRIDEDKPCYFEEDNEMGRGMFYPRSKSYAMTKRRSRMYIP